LATVIRLFSVGLVWAKEVCSERVGGLATIPSRTSTPGPHSSSQSSDVREEVAAGSACRRNAGQSFRRARGLPGTHSVDQLAPGGTRRSSSGGLAGPTARKSRGIGDLRCHREPAFGNSSRFRPLGMGIGDGGVLPFGEAAAVGQARGCAGRH
jgi:hypothetical protein